MTFTGANKHHLTIIKSDLNGAGVKPWKLNIYCKLYHFLWLSSPTWTNCISDKLRRFKKKEKKKWGSLASYFVGLCLSLIYMPHWVVKWEILHHCGLVTPVFLKVHDSLGSEVTHVAPFKSFISLLFEFFPNDFELSIFSVGRNETIGKGFCTFLLTMVR